MQHHSELLNYLIEKHKLETYLEIGTFHRDHNFNLIKAPVKMCVDPDPNAKALFLGTSDEYFNAVRGTYDIVWIDGLHEHNQVKRDFENALRCITQKGFICLHDCNPHSEAITHYPRDNREWCGNTFLFAMQLGNYSGIDFLTVDFDYGCTVVWKDKTKRGSKKEVPLTWEYFNENRKELLNLVSVEDAEKLL